MTADEQKQRAAEAALKLLPEAGLVGLGSGSTAELFIQGVGRLVAQGRALRGVATSERSRQLALQIGIPLADDSGPWDIDVCVDGADEVSAQLDLIKGGGGCHTREKIVNYSSKVNIIVVDESKLSQQLGERWAIPVEVLAFGAGATSQKLSQLGPTTLRTRNGAPWMTDAGNYIYDLEFGPLPNPRETEATLLMVPGVVATGLFVGRADLVLVAGPTGVRKLLGG
ncbi:MAG: Ribose-5-phosphate isomerase [Pseudomonadota bacterium]|jgi:ribose 5-phosphate isomerase A